MVDVTNFYAKIFVGANYDINSSKIKTVEDIKNQLEKIIADLPQDRSLEVEEFYARDENIIGYTLTVGIPHTGTSEEEKI